MQRLISYFFRRSGTGLTRGETVAVPRQRDGYWWRRLSDSAKLSYVVGYSDAAEVARIVAAAARGEFCGPEPGQAARMDAGRVVQGLEQLFDDPANWRMSLPSAMHYVGVWMIDPASADLPRLLARLRR